MPHMSRRPASGGYVRSGLAHMRDEKRAHPKPPAEEAPDRIGNEIHDQLLHTAMRQQHQVALEAVELDRLDHEKARGRGPPLGGLVIARDRAVGAALAHMMQAALPAPESKEDAAQERRDVVVPPR